MLSEFAFFCVCAFFYSTKRQVMISKKLLDSHNKQCLTLTLGQLLQQQTLRDCFDMEPALNPKHSTLSVSLVLKSIHCHHN